MFIRKMSVMGTMMLSMATHGAETNPLLGCWNCDGSESRITLRFDATHYVIDGEPLPYKLEGGAIKVPEPDGFSLYPYTLKTGRLTIHLEDSPPLICGRTACQPGSVAR